MNTLLIKTYFITALLATILLTIGEPALAGTYYVSPDGDDTNPGNRESPWLTAAHAGKQAMAGDTVIFLPGEYTDPLVPAHSGTAEDPITFKASERRQARLVGDAPGDPERGEGYRISLQGVSNIVIEGFYVEDTARDESTGGWLRMNNAAHVTLRDCQFTAGARWAHFFVRESRHIRILDSDFARNRYGGDMWRIDSTRQLLVEGNSFSRALHTLGRPQNSRQVVIRGNVFHSRWSRNFESHYNDDQLVENNLFTHAYNGGRSAGAGGQMRSLQRAIFRYNLTVHNFRTPLGLDALSTHANLHNRYYNNIFHGNYGRGIRVNGIRGNFKDLIVKNSIFDHNDPFADGTQIWLTGGGADSATLIRNAIYAGRENAEALIVYGRTPLGLADAQGEGRWKEYAAQPVTRTKEAGQGFDLPVVDAFLFVPPGNDFSSIHPIAVGDRETVATVVGVDMRNGLLQLDREIAWEADAPVIALPDLDEPGIFMNNLEVDPRFIDPDAFDFALAPDSPLRNAGEWLTTTRNAGGGREVPVEDAYYFYDGFGIEGERGDVIAIGTTDNVARIVRVDHGARILHIDRDLEWAEGAPVAFPWSGEAPDLGVYEHGDEGRSSVQILADPVYTRPGAPVVLQAKVRGMQPPLHYAWQLGDGTVAAGETVSHVYREAVDYGVRVRVTDANGDQAIGVGYVNAEPPAPEDYLIHTTFDADDEDWWIHWQFYRGRRATGFSSYRHVLDESTGRGYHEITSLRRGEIGPLPAFLHPRHWDIDEFPYVRIRYRIRPGSPIAIFVRPYPSAYHILWDMAMGQDRRRYYFAGTTNVLDRAPPPEGQQDPRPRGVLPKTTMKKTLIDDGDWHEIEFDVRDIRDKFPDVQVLEAIHIGDLEVDGGARVGRNDAFWLDEIYIGK